eukprot:5382761-Ditylum_brightwellii.AAC.1
MMTYGELGVLNSQPVPEIERITDFVEGIEDPEFKTVKQLRENYLLEIYHGDRIMNVKEFTDMVES